MQGRSAWILNALLALASASGANKVALPKREVTGLQNGGFSVPVYRRAETPARRAINAEYPMTSQWWMTLEIGTPPQSLPLLPDTGSGDFTVQSSLLPSSEQGNDPVYDPNASSTSHLISGYTFQECYGSGYCDSGVVYTDTITLGGVSVTGVPIQVINSVSSVSSNSQSGNIGMAFGAEQAANPRGVSDFSRSIRSSLAAGVFTVDYNSVTGTGFYDFGYIDTAKYTGPLQYAPVDVSSQWGGEWVVHFAGIEVNGTFHDYSWPVIVDTGTGGSYIPQEIADLYFSQVPGAQWNTAWGQYQFPCSQTLPDFILGVSAGATVALPGSLLKDLSPDGGVNCLTHFGVQNSSSDYMFGQNLQQAVFLVFDFDHGQIGFGAKSKTGSPAGTNVDAAPTLPATSGSAFICTGQSWGGSCSDVSWPSWTCNPLAGSKFSMAVGSFGPDDGACTLYSDAICETPITGLEGIKSPGNSAISGTAVSSYFCTNPAVQAAGSGTIFLCTEPGWVGSCSNLSWSSYVCQTLSETFKQTVGSAGPNQGSCLFYVDPYCRYPASGTTALKNPGTASLSYGDNIQSFMCV